MPEGNPPPTRPQAGKGFARIWARVEAVGARAEAEHDAEWAASTERFRELMACPESERGERVAADERYRSLAMVDRLLKAAERAGNGEAEGLASLASEIAAGLDAERYGALSLSKRAIVARCAWAEARRRQGDLWAAEQAFAQAAGRLDEQPLGAWERAIFCRRLAALRRDQERDDEALGLLQRARDLFTSWGKRESAAEACCESADLWLRAEDPESALSLFRAGERSVQPAQWPQLAIRIRHGLALCHAQLCQPEAAAKAWRRAQTLYMLVTDPVERLRYVATESRIAEENGEEMRAIALLRPLVGELLALGAFADAAPAALDLAKLYHGLGKTDEVRRLAIEVRPLAESGRLAETVGAVLRLALGFAAQERQDAYELLAQAADYVRQARESPGLPWRWGQEPGAEVPWEAADDDLRRRLCDEAGLPPAVSALSAAEISRGDRQLLSFTQEALHRVRVVFAAEEPE